MGACEAALRALVVETARKTPGVGEIAESVKWGQPSFTPVRPRTGSSVRIGTSRDGRPALFFICHTGLVERFRELYGDQLEFEGNRAIIVSRDNPDALRHCVALALTYHLRKKGGG